MMRTLKSALEANTQLKVDRTRTIFPWMVEWAAGRLSQFVVESIGKTRLSRIRLVVSQTSIAGFGEPILYMPLTKKSDEASLDPKFADGVWLGLRTRTDEAILGTIHVAVRARTVRRRAPQEQ